MAAARAQSAGAASSGDLDDEEASLPLGAWILHELEKGPSYLNKRKRPSRSDMRGVQQRAVGSWADLSAAAAAPMAEPGGMAALQARLPARERAAFDPGSLPRHDGGEGGNGGCSPSASTARSRPKLQRGFTVTERPPPHLKSTRYVAPGHYDTHLVGGMSWLPKASHPAEKPISRHFSAPVTSFAKPKHILVVPITRHQAPGPGHYAAPNYWDPCWQRSPSAGTTFGNIQPPDRDSRFSVLARGFGEDSGRDFGLVV